MTKGHEVTGSAAAPSGVPKMAERPGRPEPLPAAPVRTPAAAARASATGTPGKPSGRTAFAKSRAPTPKTPGSNPSTAGPTDGKPRAATNGARKATVRPAAGNTRNGTAASAKKAGNGAAKSDKAKRKSPEAEPEREDSTQQLHDLEIIERIVPETKPRGLLGISFGTIQLDRIEEKLFASSENTLARERANQRKPVLSFLKRAEKPASAHDLPIGGAKAPDMPPTARPPEHDAEPEPPLRGQRVSAPPPRQIEPATEAAASDGENAAQGPLAILTGLLRFGRRAQGGESEGKTSGEESSAAPGEEGAEAGKPAPLLARLALRDALTGLADRARALVHRGDEAEVTGQPDHGDPAAETAPPAPAPETAAPAEPVPEFKHKPARSEAPALPMAKAQGADGAATEASSRAPAAAAAAEASVDTLEPATAPAAEQADEIETAKATTPSEAPGPERTADGTAAPEPVTTAEPEEIKIEAKPAPVFAHFRSLGAGPDNPLGFADVLSPDLPDWPETGTTEPDWRARAKQVLSQAAELARELETEAAARTAPTPGPGVIDPAPDLPELADAVPMHEADAPPPDADPPPRHGGAGPQQLYLDLNAETWGAHGAARRSVDEPSQTDDELSGMDEDGAETAADRPRPYAPAPPPFPDPPAARDPFPALQRRARGFRPAGRPSILFPDPDPPAEAEAEEDKTEDGAYPTVAPGMAEAPEFSPFMRDQSAAGPIFEDSLWNQRPETPSDMSERHDHPPAEYPSAGNPLLNSESANPRQPDDTGVHGWLRSHGARAPVPMDDPPPETHWEDEPPSIAPERPAGTMDDEEEKPDLQQRPNGRSQFGHETAEDGQWENGEAAADQRAGQRWAEAYDEYEEAAAAADEWRIGDEEEDLMRKPVPSDDGQESHEDDDDGGYDTQDEEEAPAQEVVSQLNVLSRPSGRPEQAAGVMRSIARTATEYYAVPEKWPSAAKLGAAGVVLGGLLGFLLHTLLGISTLPQIVLIVIGAQMAGAVGFYRGYTKPFASARGVTRPADPKPKRRNKTEAWERMDHAPRVADSGYPEDPESFIRAFEEGRLPPPPQRGSHRRAAAAGSKTQQHRKPPARRKHNRRKHR